MDSIKDLQKRLSRVEKELDKCRTSSFVDGWQTQKHAKKARKWDYYAQEKMKLKQQIEDLEINIGDIFESYYTGFYYTIILSGNHYILKQNNGAELLINKNRLLTRFKKIKHVKKNPKIYTYKNNVQGKTIKTIHIMNEYFIFIYAKSNQIKVLTLDKAKLLEKSLLEDGWNHTATLDACIYIEYLHNKCEDVDLLDEIKLLSQNRIK